MEITSRRFTCVSRITYSSKPTYVLYARFVPQSDASGCVEDDMLQKDIFDLIYTDITGVVHLMNIAGSYWARLR